MTIDELRTRKQFLLARKREELDLQAQGKGDNFNLFMINEELLDVSAQLRALTPSCRVGPKRTTHSTYAADRQQFVDWVRQDTDEEPDDARAQMRKILCGGIASISGRQREILLLWSDGLRGKEIADRLGVDKTTVSRTLKRAKARVKRVSETRIAIDQLRDEDRLDMSDPEVSKLLMSVLTVHQAVCFYLYDAERLSVREVERLAARIKAENPPAAPKKAENVDHYYREMQLALNNELGRKVKINLRSEDKGVVEIAFYSKEDLQQIAGLLSGQHTDPEQGNG